jgi:hypothetical protein
MNRGAGGATTGARSPSSPLTSPFAAPHAAARPALPSSSSPPHKTDRQQNHPHHHHHPEPPPRKTAALTATLALLACAAGAAQAATLPASNDGAGRPCPTRMRPPPQSALRLPDDVAAASVAALELTLVDGKKMTLSRLAGGAAREASLAPGMVPGGTRYGGAPVTLGASGVRPGDVLAASAVLRTGERVDLVVPAAAAGLAVAEPAGCWRPRSSGKKPAVGTWGGFDSAAKNAARVLPAVAAVERPVAAAAAPLHRLHQKKAAAALGVDVVRSDDGLVFNSAAARQQASSALGGFLAPVFA